jgi:hypothetical protein
VVVLSFDSETERIVLALAPKSPTGHTQG